MTTYDLNADADQIIEVIAANRAGQGDQPAPDPADTRLANLESMIIDLADTNETMITIANCLNEIEDAHPDTTVTLDELYRAAGDLVQHNHNLRHLVDMVAELAKQFRQQRETAQQTLASLRKAIEDVDIKDPSIEALAESIEEYQMDMIHLVFEEMMIAHIVDMSPLDEYEIGSLLLVLDELDPDSSLWDDFRSWLDEAEDIVQTRRG